MKPAPGIEVRPTQFGTPGIIVVLESPDDFKISLMLPITRADDLRRAIGNAIEDSRSIQRRQTIIKAGKIVRGRVGKLKTIL